MNASKAQRRDRRSVRLDWWFGLLTFCGTVLVLGGWTWARAELSQDWPLTLLPGVGVLMVLLAGLYLFTLLAWSIVLGASLRTFQVSTWPLLVAFLVHGLVTTAFLGTALWGLAPLSTWGSLGLIGVGSIAGLTFCSSVWRVWWQQRDDALQLAYTDVLTGLLNRRGFLNRFDSQFPSPGTLVLIDVNQLKAINDQHGHTVGDQQIQRLAEALQFQLPPDTLVSRWGGDEFLLLFPGQSALVTQQRLESLQRQLPSLISPAALFSFGLTQLQSEQNFEQGFALADHHLYLAKGGGQAAGTGAEDDREPLEFAQQLEKLSTPEAVIREGLTSVRQQLQFDMASYVEIQERGFVILFVEYAPNFTLATDMVGLVIEADALLRQVVSERRTVVSVDYPNDPASFADVLQLGIKSLILVPVQINGQVVGVLSLSHLTTWKAIPLPTQRMLELIASRLGHTLEIHQAVTQVKLTVEGGLLALGVALEARDLETQGHTERVVEMATRLGRRLQLSLKALDELRQGAYLHDIGKLSIPDRILLKPGPLDPEEWALMQTHVDQGVAIARRLPNLSPDAIDVICCHHERWDGSGYPAGLRGEAIPLSARIFAVCDVYDALTSDRPYKNAWAPETAHAEIMSQRGRQFCPMVIEAFESMI